MCRLKAQTNGHERISVSRYTLIDMAFSMSPRITERMQTHTDSKYGNNQSMRTSFRDPWIQTTSMVGGVPSTRRLSVPSRSGSVRVLHKGKERSLGMARKRPKDSPGVIYPESINIKARSQALIPMKAATRLVSSALLPCVRSSQKRTFLGRMRIALGWCPLLLPSA